MLFFPTTLLKDQFPSFPPVPIVDPGANLSLAENFTVNLLQGRGRKEVFMVSLLLTLPKSGHLTGTEHPRALQKQSRSLAVQNSVGLSFLTSVAVILLYSDYKLGVVCWLWVHLLSGYRSKLGSPSLLTSILAFEFYRNGGEKKENAASSDVPRVRSSGLVKGLVLKEYSLPWIDLTATTSGSGCFNVSALASMALEYLGIQV